MLSSVEQAFVGRDEKRAPLKNACVGGTTVYLIFNCELKILRTILMLLRDNHVHKIRKYIRDTAVYLVYMATYIAFRLVFEEKLKQKDIGLA